jgi:hypothetical protein
VTRAVTFLRGNRMRPPPVAEAHRHVPPFLDRRIGYRYRAYRGVPTAHERGSEVHHYIRSLITVIGIGGPWKTFEISIKP